ncbi:hypothetical protein D8674_029015 [Pyrus ussuriensis x Pyrus communis]|uniref:Uncharacterized protein n=1 Tax=Pyrus ussuriensis x Pyrus communis TaxID=2448454 RepID=A0A5N5HYU8_9ROSA|nr:hypothetical protein D8674_029015 [Pyrus ussuriensis x Pyrus communis]
MEDKNKDQSVLAANPNNLWQHFEFAHAISVAMRNNCPTAEWRSWKFVVENAKKAVMDELLCKYTLDDDTNEQLMKLMEDALEGGYNRWRYDKLVVRSERYRWKQMPYFGDKSMFEAYAELIYVIGDLVRRECSTEFESWKKVPEELKKFILGELSVHWDVDETDEKQRKHLDRLFRKRFHQWKFDVLWHAKVEEA